MYQFSRSLYRELAQDVVSGRGEDTTASRMEFLRACESSMERLALDRHYFAKPVKTLFRDVRHFFPMTEQLRVFRMCQKHMTLATLRRDGSPRISGTELELDTGELVLGMMPGSRKALDLLRDARLALHSPSVDPPPEDASSWPGEAKVAGRAVEITDRDPADGAHWFRVEITEVVLTRVVGDDLVIESWHPDRGFQRRERR